MNTMQDAAYSASPMTQPFLSAARVFQPSPDPDTAAVETIELMRSYIKDSARDPLVQSEARRAVEQYPSILLALAGISGNDARLSSAAREQGIAESCWAWAKHNLKFVHHSKLLGLWIGKDDALQLLVSPDVIVHALNGTDRQAAGRARQGDCAVYSPMICALLEALGLDWELVIAAVDGNQPDIFTHVWPRAVLSDGRRISLDASHGSYPGWHVPVRDIHRLQVFDSSGRPVPDQGDTFSGFGQYIQTGLGDIDPYAGLDQTIAPAISGEYNYALDSPPYLGSDYSYNPGRAPAGGSSFNWGNTVGGLLSQWTKIGADVIAPRTNYSVGKDGSVSYSTPGASMPPNSAAFNIGGGGNTLLWVGGGLAALFVLGSMFKAGK